MAEAMSFTSMENTRWHPSTPTKGKLQPAIQGYSRVLASMTEMAQKLTFSEKGEGNGEKDRKSTVMYGDLVNGIAYTLFLPVYVYMALTEEEREGGPLVAGLFAWVAFWSWLSYWHSSSLCCLLACCGQCAGTVAMNLYEWPHPGEIVVTPQFFWSLLITSSNQNLNLALKLSLGVVAFACAVAVTVLSPLADPAETSPLLLGALVVYWMFHYCAVVTKDAGHSPTATARMALMVLAGTFAHHIAGELITMLSTSGYALTGGFSILKAGFFGAVGLAAAGAFRREIDLNENLSRLVEERAKELNKQSARLQMIGFAMEKSETAVAITDAAHKILWANAALGLLAGMGETQLERQSIIQALPMTYWDRSKLKNCFSTQVVEDEVHIHDHVYRAQISPYPNQVDQTCDSAPRFVVVFRDITEKKERERAEKLAEEESLLSRGLTEAMEMLSHELRTPLQGIMGMTSLLLADNKLPHESREPLSLIMASSRLLLTLINNMLDIRKCDANMMESFALSDHAAGPSLKEAVDFCRPIGSIAGVELVSQTTTTDCTTVKINPVRLQQMIINLVSNAIKYSPKRGTVTISTCLMTLADVDREMETAIATGPKCADSTTEPQERSRTTALCVCVSDEGPGVSEESRMAIFQKFSQLKTKEENTLGGLNVGQPSGTGLGLNLCIKFAARMRGTMWVKNNSKGGSSFCFYLPVVSGPMVAPALQPASSLRSLENRTLSLGEPCDSTSSCRILVVDDTLINLKVLRRMLERIGVKSITTVESGEQALEAISSSEQTESPFDLVITDIQMPGMDGFELTRVIHERAELEGSSPIVVGLTAETSETLHQKAENSGMRSILFKPITAIEMKQFLSVELNLDL